MDFISKIIQGFHLFTNQVYIPKDFVDLDPPILLHMSDTPEEIYPYIFKVIEKTQPDYVVHTGDFADNLKMEVVPDLRQKYKKAMEGFVRQMESYPIKKVYYTLGNHDELWDIIYHLNRGDAREAIAWQLGEYTLYAEHYYRGGVKDVDFYFYGHSFDPPSHNKQGIQYFNGLEALRFISMKNGKVFELPYPFGTDGFRKMDRNHHVL